MHVKRYTVSPVIMSHTKSIPKNHTGGKLP